VPVLTSSQRKFLRGEAHHLDPVVLIGKSGVTDALIGAANAALDAHELIKIKFNDFKDQRTELTHEVEERTQSQLCGLIGNVAILYRQQSDPDKRKIDLPR
jgi:RNA-binding protein